MINETWPLRPLGELFEIGAGKTMSAAARDGAEKTSFLRTSNVLWDEIDLTKVDEMAIPPLELSGKLLRPNDLLVCEGGEIGRAAIWNGEREVMSFQNHLHRLRPLTKDVDPRFYVYFLQCGFTQLGIFEGAGNKTTIPNLSRNRLAALEVPHPNIDEQRDIVRGLALVRDAMKLHDRSTLLAQDLKRAAMRSLFSNGLFGKTQKETEFGPIPENWDVVLLGSLGRVGSGTTPDRTRPEYWRGNIPWVTSGRMYEREITGSEECVTAVAIENSSLPMLRPGAVLIAIVGQGKTLGHCAILRVDATISRHVGYIQPDEKRVVPEYLRGFLESQYESLRQLASGNGSTRAALTGAIIKTITVPLPPTLEEQREIVAVLEAIDSKIDLHRRKRAVLDELFSTLLYKLMTGEIRVTDLDLSNVVQNSTAEAAV